MLTAEVPEKPCQPKDYNFPKRVFGKKGDTSRAFQSHWFKIWTFLHYDEAKDVVFCHTCMVAAKRKMLSTNNLDPAFVSCSINNNCYGLFNLYFFLFFLNYLMLLHIHKTRTDEIDLKMNL